MKKFTSKPSAQPASPLTASSAMQASLAQLARDLKHEAAEAVKQAAANAARHQQEAQEKANQDPGLFRAEMAGIQPLKPTDRVLPPPPSKRLAKADPVLVARRAAAEGFGQDSETRVPVISDTRAALNPVSAEAHLAYRQPTLPLRIYTDLKAGKLRWYEAVDLHGCTIDQAREGILELIGLAQCQQQTVVKIVHGKGAQGLLKTYVNGWLQQHEQVLAFVSAPDNQGGTGAVLVLLKKIPLDHTLALRRRF